MLSDDDLDKPSHAPQEFGPGFGTVAGCYTAIVIHPTFHAGQVADARRAAGIDGINTGNGRETMS